MYRVYQQTVTHLILRYLRQYISNVEADLQISLYGGDVILNDLDLRLGVLNKQIGIDAPFALTRGFIKELKIHLPWSSITATPVRIELSSVELTLSNNYDTSSPSAYHHLRHSNTTATNTTQRRRNSFHGVSGAAHAHENRSDGAKSVDHISLNNDEVQQEQEQENTNDDELQEDEKVESMGGGFISNLLMRIMANASITINDLSIKYVDHNCKCEATFKIQQFQTVATTLNWQPRPEVSGYDIFLTPWKLCHRSSSFKNVSLFLDVCKPQVKEEALFLNLSIDIRLKAYLHWLWHGGVAPKMDMSSTQPVTVAPQTKRTQSAMSCHSAPSGPKHKHSKRSNALLEHISVSSIQSGRSQRSIRSVHSVRSDGAISTHSIDNADSSNDEDSANDLGPVLMCHILVTNHIDVKLSCYQLSMAAKMLHNVTQIFAQKEAKSSSKKHAHKTRHKRTVSAPVASTLHNEDEEEEEKDKGWWNWVGSFFYDSEEEEEGLNIVSHPSECVLVKFECPSITCTLRNSRETATNTMMYPRRYRSSHSMYGSSYTQSRKYRKSSSKGGLPPINSMRSPQYKSSRGSTVSSHRSGYHYSLLGPQSVRAKTYAVTCYTFAEMRCDDINAHLCVPIIPKHLRNHKRRKSFTGDNEASTSDENQLGEEHFHKSFILTIGALSVMDFVDNQPLPVIVWAHEKIVNQSFPFVSKPSHIQMMKITPTSNEYHPGFFHERINTNSQFEYTSDTRVHSPHSIDYSFQIDCSSNAISFYKSTGYECNDELTMSTEISIGYLSVFADFKSTGISRFISECSTFLSFGLIKHSHHKHSKRYNKRKKMSSPLSNSFDAERQSVISDESFVSQSGRSYASTSQQYDWSYASLKDCDSSPAEPPTVSDEIPVSKLRINIASVSVAVRVSDIEDWKLESLYLNNVNTLLLEVSGVDVKILTRSTPVALNISWTKTQDYSVLLSGACVRFLMTQPKRIHNQHVSNSMLHEETNTEHYESFIWRQVLFDEETMKKLAADFLRFEHVLLKYKVSKNIRTVPIVSSMPREYTASPVLSPMNAMDNDDDYGNLDRPQFVTRVSTVSVTTGFKQDSKWNCVEGSLEFNDLTGSFSLRHSHFIFTALAAASNVSELYCILYNKPLLNRTGHEWQTVFQKLRPKPSAKTPYDELMTQSIFNFKIGSSSARFALYGDYPEIDKKRDSSFGLCFSSIKCETNRNDMNRMLFEGPIHLNPSKDKKASPLNTRNMFQLSCTASPKLIAWLLPKSVPLRHIPSNVHPGPRSGSIICRMQSLGVLWDGVLHDMVGYAILLTMEFKKLVLGISKENDKRRKRRRHRHHKGDSSPEPSPTTPTMKSVSDSSKRSEDAFVLDRERRGSGDSLMSDTVTSWRILISRLNTMIVDLKIEPFVYCWPLSDPFHIRDEYVISNLKNSNNILLKSPKVELSIGKDVTLVCKDAMFYSYRHEPKIRKSFDYYILSTMKSNKIYPIIEPFSATLQSNTEMSKKKSGLKFGSPESMMNKPSKVLFISLNCQPLKISFNAHQAVCISSVLRNLLSRRFVPDERTHPSLQNTPYYTSTETWNDEKDVAPKLEQISAAYHIEKQIAQQTLPVRFECKIPDITCCFYPDATSSEFSLNKTSNYLQLKVYKMNIAAEFNQNLELTKWKGDLAKISCQYLHYAKHALSHPSHQLFNVNKIQSFYSQQIPHTNNFGNPKDTSNMDFVTLNGDLLKFVYVQAHVEPVKIVYNAHIIDKMIMLFSLLKIPDFSLSSKAAYQAEWARKLATQSTMNRSVSYLKLSSTKALLGDQTNDTQTNDTHPQMYATHTPPLNRPTSASTIPPTAADRSATDDTSTIPLTEDNVQKLQDYHKLFNKSQPMPNDPAHLIKPNKSIITQVWVCIKVDGIQFTVPSERPTYGAHGVTIEFDELWVHTKQLSHDFHTLIPFPLTHKHSTLRQCTSCQKLLQRRTSQTIPTTPNTPQFIATPISRYNDNTHFIRAESALKGLKLFIVKWPSAPPQETTPNQTMFYKEIKWESGIVYDNDTNENSIKFSRHMLTNQMSVTVNIDILSNLTWYTRDVDIGCHWSNVKGVVSAEQLAIVLSVADAFSSRYRAEKIVTPSTNTKPNRSRHRPEWLSTWEIHGKLKADLPNLTIDVKLERQSKSSPWFRIQISDIYSQHLLSSHLLEGLFRAGDISLQFFDSSSKYCLLSLREASRPNPHINEQNTNKSRQSSSHYPYVPKLSIPTSTIHENEEQGAPNNTKTKPHKMENKLKHRRPAIFMDYRNTRKQRQETKDGSAAFDSCVNVEVVGFDLLIPFTIIESLTRAANRLSALSSIHRARNTEKQRSKRHGYAQKYRYPVGQERVVRELDSVIPGFHTRKFKLIIYGGAIGITSDLTSVHTLTRHLQKNQYRKSDYLLYQWKIKPSHLIAVVDEKENENDNESKKSKKHKKKKDKDDTEQSKSAEKDKEMDSVLQPNDDEHKLTASDDESGSMEFPVHRMYHRCAHCDYHYQPDAYYNSSHPKGASKKPHKKDNHRALSSTTVILHCLHIFAFTSPSEVKPGHSVASITNNSTFDISGLRVELGHNLRTEQLLYPIMSPMNLIISQNVKWLVATTKDGRWPVGCPFEPIKHLSINMDEVQVRVEPQHIETVHCLALELTEMIQSASSDLQMSPTLQSLSYETTSSSDKDKDKDKLGASPTPPLGKQESKGDDDVFVSPPIPPPIDHNHDVSDDGWETPNTDEEQDQFDLEPHHGRINSFSYSLSKSMTTTSVSHSGYTTSSVSGMGNRWFFQNDLNSMKQSYRTDSDGRPFVNHIIYSEGMEIEAAQKREHSKDDDEDDDGKEDEKREHDKTDVGKKDKKKGKKHKLSMEEQEKMNKQHMERWMTWRYPSPRHVSHVSTSPIYQLLAHAILAVHDDDASVSVSTAPSLSVPAPPSIITTYIPHRNSYPHQTKWQPPATTLTSTQTAPSKGNATPTTSLNEMPNDSDFSSKRQSFSFSRETIETEPTAPHAHTIGHGYMCFIGIHAWDTVLRKYVDVDSFYVELDIAGTHQLKRMIIADEWKISWKLIPPTNISKGSDCVTQQDMPSSMELAKLIRIDSQLHVGPLYSHIRLKIDQSNFAVCNRLNNGVEEDLLNVDVRKTEINYGQWKPIKDNKILYQAIRLKIAGLQLTAPNYRDLTLYDVTNSFQIRAVIRMRKDKQKMNSSNSYRERIDIVPVTVATVAPGETSLDLYTGDIEVYFRRRLVFLCKYMIDCYTKIFKRLSNKQFHSKYQYSEPYGRETRLPGYSSGLHPAAEYVLENYCSLALWYGQINTPQKRVLPSKSIHSFCWWNAAEQRLRLSVDNGEHWSDPFEIDIEIPPPPSPFPKNTTNTPNNAQNTSKSTTNSNVKVKFKNVAGINILEQKILVKISDFKCEIIVRIEKKLRNNFTKISFFPEFRFQNILNKTIAIKIHQPRFENSLPERFASHTQCAYIKPKEQYFFMVFASTSRFKFGRRLKCELFLRIIDDEEGEDKALISPHATPIHSATPCVESQEKLLTNFFENCEGIHIRSSPGNLPQIQVVSARPTPKMKDKQTNYTHYLKFKEYCWIVEEYQDPFFSVTIRPFMTFKNETCSDIWVLNDMVLRKTRTRLKRLSSPSKHANDAAEDEEEKEDKEDKDENIDPEEPHSEEHSKDEKKTSEYPLLFGLNIGPKLIRAHGAHLRSGDCIDFLMIPDMREEKELKLYICTTNDIFVATHFVRPLIYIKDECVSFDARWVPIDIEHKEDEVNDTNIIDESEDDEILAVDMSNATIEMDMDMSIDPDDGKEDDKDPELNLDTPTDKANDTAAPPMAHGDSTEKAAAMAKIIVLRQHRFSSFHASKAEAQGVYINHESETEPIVPNRITCGSRFMQYSVTAKRKASPNWNPISPSPQDLDYTTLCISVHSTYTVRNRTAHRVHLKCHDLDEKYVGEEIVVIEPHSNQPLFWPRDISPVLRVALESNESKMNGCKWCRPVILNTEEPQASYQIHMKSGRYLFVCVLTHDRIDQESIEINIRPKHMIHNKIGRPLMLWPCGMIDRSVSDISVHALDPLSIVTIQNTQVVNIAQWRIEFDDIAPATTNKENANDDVNKPRVVSAAVRVTFDYKHDKISKKAEQSSSDLQVLLSHNHWEWSKQIFIPNSMSRGRRHVMVNNHLYGYEDLVSFVTLLHRSVVHTIFFRCGQPPCLIRNETSHILIFSQPKDTANHEDPNENTEHMIAPYQASAFDWRAELDDKYDESIASQIHKKDETKGSPNQTKKGGRRMSSAERELKEWEDEERIFQKTSDPTSIVIRIDGYCVSDRIMLRHGLSKTVTLYRMHDNFGTSHCMTPELTLNIRVLTRRGTFIVEVLHVAQSTPNNSKSGALGTKRPRDRTRRHSQQKPQKFDGISAKIILNSLSVRLQQEHGREIEERTNLYLQRLVIDFSKHKQEQFPTPILSPQQYQNAHQPRPSQSISSHLHPSYPQSPSVSSNAAAESPSDKETAENKENDSDIHFGQYQSYCPLYNVSHLPPPSSSICSQYSLNIKLESFQIDDQSMKPEFPVIGCFDPTHRRNLNRSGRDPRLIIAIVWQSPLQLNDTAELIKTLPNSYMLRQFQEQRDLYFTHYRRQSQLQSKHSKHLKMKNALSPTYPRHRYHGHHGHVSLSPEIIYFDDISNLVAVEDDSSSKDSDDDDDYWRVDGLQNDSDIRGHFPDFKLISIYLHPTIFNTTDSAIIGSHSLLHAAFSVDVCDFENYEFIAYGCGDKEEADEARLFGVDHEFLSLIRSVTGPRLYIHSCNIFELTFRISMSFGEIPVHIGVHNSPLVLQPISLSSVQCAPDRLIHEMLAMYMADLAFQTPALLGSLNALGNPTQLIENIGMGFHKFVSIPRQSLADGPQAFVWGAGRGFVALLQHVSEGTFTSVSTFSDSLARNLERLSSDDQYKRARQRMRNTSDSFLGGIGSFAHSVMGGISGVVQNPSRGYTETGAWGFIKGVGTGLVGAFTKPISGALDLVAAASRSIATSTGSHSDSAQIKRRHELSDNPFICNKYCAMKYCWISLRRNEHYLLHIPNVKILKKVIKKSETKFKKMTRANCTLLLTDCGIFIVDAPICEDKIAEVFDWTETNLVNNNLVNNNNLQVESANLSGSSYRAMVTAQQMKLLNQMKLDPDADDIDLLSNYHTGELLKLNNDDDLSPPHPLVTMTHPHSVGPVSLWFAIANKRQRHRFKLAFNTLRGSCDQMMHFWRKECVKRRKSQSLKLSQQKELQHQLQQHLKRKKDKKKKKKKKNTKHAMWGRTHSQSYSYSESVVEHQYHRNMMNTKWILNKSQSEKRFVIDDDEEEEEEHGDPVHIEYIEYARTPSMEESETLGGFNSFNPTPATPDDEEDEAIEPKKKQTPVPTPISTTSNYSNRSGHMRKATPAEMPSVKAIKKFSINLNETPLCEEMEEFTPRADEEIPLTAASSNQNSYDYGDMRRVTNSMITPEPGVGSDSIDDSYNDALDEEEDLNGFNNDEYDEEKSSKPLRPKSTGDILKKHILAAMHPNGSKHKHKGDKIKGGSYKKKYEPYRGASSSNSNEVSSDDRSDFDTSYEDDEDENDEDIPQAKTSHPKHQLSIIIDGAPKTRERAHTTKVTTSPNIGAFGVVSRHSKYNSMTGLNSMKKSKKNDKARFGDDLANSMHDDDITPQEYEQMMRFYHKLDKASTTNSPKLRRSTKDKKDKPLTPLQRFSQQRASKLKMEMLTKQILASKLANEAANSVNDGYTKQRSNTTRHRGGSHQQIQHRAYKSGGHHLNYNSDYNSDDPPGPPPNLYAHNSQPRSLGKLGAFTKHAKMAKSVTDLFVMDTINKHSNSAKKGKKGKKGSKGSPALNSYNPKEHIASKLVQNIEDQFGADSVPALTTELIQVPKVNTPILQSPSLASYSSNRKKTSKGKGKKKKKMQKR
eukprot:251096_1